MPTCWNWSDLGQLPNSSEFGVVAGSTVYYTVRNDNDVYAATYPALADLGVAFSLPADRRISGMALDGNGDIWLVVNDITLNRAELWFCDVSAGTESVIASYSTGDLWDGQAAYNPTNGLLYVASNFARGATSQTDLWEVDPGTGTRTSVVDRHGSLGDPEVTPSMSITSDGGVWFISEDTGAWMDRYDPSTSVVVSEPIGSTYGFHPISPLGLADDTVVLYDDPNFDEVYQYTFAGGAITESRLAIADLNGTTGPYWIGTHDGHAFNWDDHLWTFDTICPGGGLTVGFLRLG